MYHAIDLYGNDWNSRPIVKRVSAADTRSLPALASQPEDTVGCRRPEVSQGSKTSVRQYYSIDLISKHHVGRQCI